MILDLVRASLIERGLLAQVDGEYRLTDAGHAATEELIAELDRSRIDEDFAGRSVRWNYNPKRGP